MFREVEPFKSFSKALDLYGFGYANISSRYKFCSIIAFASVCPYWILVAASLFQFKDINDLTEKLLYIPGIMGIVLKAFNLFWKFDEFKLLMKSLDKIYDDEKFKKYLENASRKAMILGKVQFVSITAACVVAFVMPYMIVPMYEITFAGWETPIYWFYKILQNISIFYNSYLMLSVDLMATGIMMIIAEYFNYLNDEIRSLKFDDKASEAKSEFIRCIQMHRQQKQ